MIVLYLIAVLGITAIANGSPMPQPNGPTVVPGVFISADALQNLQNRANGNTNQGYQPSTNIQNPQPTSNQVYQPNTNVPNTQPITNQAYQPNTVVQNPQPSPSYQPSSNSVNPQPTYQPVNSNQPQYQYPRPSNSQPVMTVQPSNNQPIMTVQPSNNQPIMTVQPPNNQPIMTIQPSNNQPAITNQPVIGAQLGTTNSNQPNIVLTNRPNSQPGQQIIYVQQQLPNGQTILVPQTQTSQPVQPSVLNPQPNQGIILQNGQPTMVITNGNGGNQNQRPSSNTVYTLIPLTGQNSNSNTGPYIIPLQSGSSSPIVLNASH